VGLAFQNEFDLLECRNKFGLAAGSVEARVTQPAEFTKEAVAAASVEAFAPYKAFHASGEPYRSLIDANPWTRPPNPKGELEWGKGWYYDTTVGRKHPEWRDSPLPKATKDIHQLRRDFYEWGYCLIEDGVSAEQCARLRARVVDQAAAERALGIAYLGRAQQHVWALVNKGEMFVRCMEHDPDAVQAGPLIEQLLDEALGPGWSHLSFIANISYPGCHPQGLHQDQSLAAPYAFLEAPVLINTIYILQDVNEVNGGTLIIPGSHKLYREGGGKFGVVPRAINLEAKAGTILLKDGRVLHGGAVNRSEHLRYIITNSVVRPFIRQQECFHLTISPEVLKTASEKFLWRCGFQATGGRSMVEGYGYSGNGAIGDPNGALVHVRRMMDAGTYRHLRPLGVGDAEKGEADAYGLVAIQRAHETFRNERFRDMVEGITAL
jgi:ectoine hydroxylase-related dioxygenase (phytanoyl-CoA dioxygenase family)